MDTRSIVMYHLQATVEAFTPLGFPATADDAMLLQEFMLDSVAYTSLLTALEGEFGFIPMGILRGVAFPETIGELIEAYQAESAAA